MILLWLAQQIPSCAPLSLLKFVAEYSLKEQKNGLKTLYIQCLSHFQAPAKESMRQDLNLRPLRPERSALPS